MVGADSLMVEDSLGDDLPGLKEVGDFGEDKDMPTL